MFSFVDLLFTIIVVNNVHLTSRKEVNLSSKPFVCISRCVLILIRESALRSEAQRLDVLYAGKHRVIPQTFVSVRF